VHEMLSEAGVDKVGVLDLIRRLAATVACNMVNPEAVINISVTGDNMELSSQRATGLALVANELLQNALEHGLAGRGQGNITITLTDEGHRLTLKVRDDGRGLPPGFNPHTDLGLGLEIVRATVTEDMQGQFDIGPAHPPPGALVQIALPIHALLESQQG
jgi:two-component sensor histidine kinase